MGIWASNHPWLILSKQDLMSPSSIHLHAPLSECSGALLHGVRTASFLAKPVGIGVGEGFRDGVQGEQVECLHRSVLHRGDPEGRILPLDLGMYTRRRGVVDSQSLPAVNSFPFFGG